MNSQTASSHLKPNLSQNVSQSNQSDAVIMQKAQHPQSLNKSAKFWNRMAKGYAKRPVADQKSYQKKLDVTGRYLHSDAAVLEIGCGTGSTALYHAPNVSHILATDVSSKMIEIAKGKATAQGVNNVTFEALAIDQLTIPDQSLDVVMAHSILHLIENPDEVITRVYRMLKPGGVFVSSTACLGDTMKFFKFIGPIGSFFGVLPILNVFTERYLHTSLINAGFEIDYQWQPSKGKSVFIVAKKTQD